MSYPNNRSGFGAGFMGDDQSTIELSSESEQPAQNPYDDDSYYRRSFPITQPTPLKRRRSYSLSLSDHGTGSPLRPITPPDQRIPTPSPPPTVINADSPVKEAEPDMWEDPTWKEYADPNKGDYNDAQPPSDSE